MREETRREVEASNVVEEYIQALGWSPHTTDSEKVLVACHIQCFAAWLRQFPEAARKVLGVEAVQAVQEDR